MRSIKTWRLRASRAALVATARYAVTPCASMMLRNSRNAAVASRRVLRSNSPEVNTGMAEAHRRANRLDNFPVVGGTDARDHQPERVRAGVDRREMDGFAKS